MKNFYFVIIFLFLGLLTNAQTSPTGSSTEVGITEGQLSVSLSGAATYAVPIAVPPGINGVVPQVGLVYNSQGGNGMAGYGWNISGVSTISRIPSTKFHDGAVDGVDFNWLDRFALDGQRLIVKNGTSGVYGANGTVYETESFSNIKIASYGVHPNGANYGPAYFIVEYPDGSKAYYGNSLDSRSITDWAITYWENPQGVRISYSYVSSNNSLYISSIKYGSMGTSTPINQIQFAYKNRQRPEQMYVGGQSILRTNILSTINVTGNGVGFRSYLLGHDQTSLGYDRLKSVTETSGDGSKSYNPTMFNYENKDVVISSKSATSTLNLGDINSQNSATFSGDFDGDAKMDFVLYPTTGITLKKKFWVFSGLQNSSFNSPTTVECGTFEEIFPATYLTSNGKMMTEQGIVVVQMPPANYVINFNIYRRGILDYSKQVAFPARENCNEPSMIRAKKFLSGDFNGDGLTDVVAIETQAWNCTKSPMGKAYFIDLDRRNTGSFWKSAGILGSFRVEDKFEAFDVNGDGKTDVVQFSKGSVTVYTLNSNNQLENLSHTLDTDINMAFAILPGDYNGDGKMDFIIPKSEGIYSDNSYAKFLSTGPGFVKTIQTYGFRNMGSSSDKDAVYISNLIPLDFNGDGKTDMVHFRSVGAKNGNSGRIIIKSFSNNGSSFTDSYEFDTGLGQQNLSTIKTFPIPIFLSPNKNNQYLGVGAISNSLIYSFDIQKDFGKENLISSIITGNGVTETISYSPLQQDPYEPFYTPTIFTETFPNVDIITAPNFKIVTQLEKQSAAVYKKQLFTYTGAVSNLEGLGFLGFRSTLRTNWHDDDSNMISSIAKNDISLRGANIENYAVSGYASANDVPAKYISKSTTVYNTAYDALQKNKVFKLKIITSKENNALENTSSETNNEYDIYNNITKSTALLKEGATTVQTTVSTISYLTPGVSLYSVGIPSSKNQSVTVAGDVISTQENYQYSNSLLSQIRKKGTNTDFITEDNYHDSFGNIVTKIITIPGLQPRMTRYEYDASGRFLTKSTDIEGLSTTFIYNSSNGLLLSETNPYGLTTSYGYDSWFKKTKTTDYLGKSNTYTYTRSGAKSIVTSTGDDGSASEETFDDLGRKTKAGSKNITGTFAYVDYLYDIQDRNYKVSEPYIGTGGTQWNETKYDEYGRIIQNIAFTGKTTNISYSGLSTTVNDGTKSKTSVKNAMGNVVSMTDTPGGTIKYTYFANGNLKESDYGGVKTTISQDGWGRKTKLVDTSAGTYTYEYNALGETTKETTPNGITTYTLDAVGKVTQKTISGTNTNSKTSYTYDSASKLLLSSKFADLANGTNAITNAYTYDAYKRILKTTETTPFATFSKEVSYDAFGRINTETSTATAGGKTSAKTIKNTYKNGSHWQILDNASSAVLWQTNTINARGQLTNAQNGPTTITNAYDTYGFATQYKYDKTSGSTNILTLNTVFDPKKGNLTSRTNSLFNKTENFLYDSQDRLIEFTNTQGVQEKQSYDDKGRITQNNLGTYSYTKTDKPYQNTSLTVSAEALKYYTPRPTQTISYNTFKAPVQIEETGVDKISFNYNESNSRTAMFYGGLQTDKLQRPLRKYYSADGTMEIKQNIVTGVFEFVTYIGGDGYDAPIVLKSNGTTQNYLYLQRDYQGSIVAITDQTGAVLEKRLFDAWGAIVKVQDGAGNVLAGLTVLDRGYTGHEHLQSVGLINMNGRIYDPKLHRFLQPDNFVQDPFNTQNYNRYGYCWNNPLRYTDASGEFIWVPILIGAIVGAISGGVAYSAHAIQTGNWNIGQFGMAVLGGAIMGGISGGVAPMSVVGASMGSVIGSAFIGGMMPAYGVQVGDWSFSISPAIAFGNTSGIGASLSVTYSAGDFSFSAGVGIMSNSNYNGLGKNGMEIRKSILASYDDGKNGVSLGSNFWSGTGDMNEFSQQTGTLGLHFGDFRAQYENDGGPVLNKLGDANDSYRTAALNLSVGKFSAGFNLFTGARPTDKQKLEDKRYGFVDSMGVYHQNPATNEQGTKYRLGALTGGYASYRVGVNSEHVRHAIQNAVIHRMIGDNEFVNTSWDWKGYSQYRTSNGFTSW